MKGLLILALIMGGISLLTECAKRLFIAIKEKSAEMEKKKKPDEGLFNPWVEVERIKKEIGKDEERN